MWHSFVTILTILIKIERDKRTTEIEGDTNKQRERLIKKKERQAIRKTDGQRQTQRETDRLVAIDRDRGSDRRQIDRDSERGNTRQDLFDPVL